MSTPLGDPYTWGANPLYFSYVKLFIRDIHSLSVNPASRCEHVLNHSHPLSRAHILGRVVALADKFTHLMLAIDDGTDIIHCTLWTKTKEGHEKLLPTAPPTLGDLVRVLGKLRIPRWRGQKIDDILMAHDGANSCLRREMIVEHVANVVEENEEVMHWAQVMRLWKEVYEKPAQWSARKRPETPQAVVDLSELVLNEVRIARDVHFGEHLTDYEKSKLAMASTMFSVKELEARPAVRQALSAAGEALLPAVIKRLKRDGYIYEVEAQRYPGKDFALVTHVTTIGPSIVAVLQQAKAWASAAHPGMWKSQICREMRKDPRCAKIPETRVERSLKMLVEEGHLVETVTEKYVLAQDKA